MRCLTYLVRAIIQKLQETGPVFIPCHLAEICAHHARKPPAGLWSSPEKVDAASAEGLLVSLDGDFGFENDY